MASNKKAQILAAVMCASSIFGSYTVVSAADTPTADTPTKIESTGKNSSVIAGNGTITATAGEKSQQSTIRLGNNSLSIDVGKQTTTDGSTTYGTFTLNSSNLTVNNNGFTLNNKSLFVKNADGIVVGSISNTGAITGTGLNITAKGINETTIASSSVSTNGISNTTYGKNIIDKAINSNDSNQYAQSQVSYNSGVQDTVTNTSGNKTTSNVTATAVTDNVYDNILTNKALATSNITKGNVKGTSDRYGSITLTANKYGDIYDDKGNATNNKQLGSTSLSLSNNVATISSTGNTYDEAGKQQSTTASMTLNGNSGIVSLSGKNVKLDSNGLYIYDGTNTSAKATISKAGAITGTGLNITSVNSGDSAQNAKSTVSYNQVQDFVTNGAYKTTSTVGTTGVTDSLEKWNEGELENKVSSTLNASGLTTTVQSKGNDAGIENINSTKNKTESKVAYNSVTDTVYDANGKRTSYSNVGTTSIADIIYASNGSTTLASSNISKSVSGTTESGSVALTANKITTNSEGKTTTLASNLNLTGDSATLTSGSTLGSASVKVDNATGNVAITANQKGSQGYVTLSGKNVNLGNNTFSLKNTTTGKDIAKIDSSGLTVNGTGTSSIKSTNLTTEAYVKNEITSGAMTTTARGGEWPSDADNKNKTTSQVSATGVRDTVYDNGGQIKATSSVTTSGIANTVNNSSITNTVNDVNTGKPLADSRLTTSGISNTTTDLAMTGNNIGNKMTTALNQNSSGISASATKKGEDGATIGTSTLTLGGDSASLKVGNYYGFAVDSNNNVSITGKNATLSGNKLTLTDVTTGKTATLDTNGLSLKDANGTQIGGVSAAGAVSGTSLSIKAPIDPIKPNNDYVESKVTTSGVADTIKQGGFTRATSNVTINSIKDTIYTNDGKELSSSNISKSVSDATESGSVTLIANKITTNDDATTTTLTSKLNLTGDSATLTSGSAYVKADNTTGNVLFSGKNVSLSGSTFTLKDTTNGKTLASLGASGLSINNADGIKVGGISNTGYLMANDGMNVTDKNSSWVNIGTSTMQKDITATTSTSYAGITNKIDTTLAGKKTYTSGTVVGPTSVITTVQGSNTTDAISGSKNKTTSTVSATGVTDTVYNVKGNQVASSSVTTNGIVNTTTNLSIDGSTNNTMSSSISQNNRGISASATKKDENGTVGTSTLTLAGNSASLKVNNKYGFAVDSNNNVSIAGNNATLYDSTFTLKDGSNNTARLTATGLTFTDASGQPIGGVSSTGVVSGTRLDIDGTSTSSIKSTNATTGAMGQSQVSYYGVTDTVTNAAGNKTTSQVSATGTIDQVYDVDGKTRIAYSNVTTSGITNNTNISGIAIKDDEYNTKTMSTSIAQNANGVNISSTKYNVYNDGTNTVQTTDGTSTISVNGAKTTISGYGYKYEKDENGKLILDEKGNPIRSYTNASLSVDGESGIIGLSGKNVGLDANGLRLYKDVEGVKTQYASLNAGGLNVNGTGTTNITSTNATTGAIGQSQVSYNGVTDTVTNAAGNKTTSTVNATGTIDQVYDVDGKTRIAYSNVTTSGITDSFTKDGVTNYVTTNANGTTFASTGNGATTIKGGSITTNSITVAGNTIDGGFFDTIGHTSGKTEGIDRYGDDNVGYTTSIETTFKVHSLGTGSVDIFGSKIESTLNGQTTVINGGSITTNSLTVGNVSFGDLVNRVDVLEDKTQNITPSNPGTGEGGSAVPPTTEGQTGMEGDLIVGDKVTANSGTIGGVTMENNTVTATTVTAKTGNFENIAVGGENGTAINKDGVTVGGTEGTSISKDGVTVGDKTSDNYTSITNNDVVVNNNGNKTSLTDVGNRVTGLESSVSSMNNRLSDVEDRIDKVGAMSAAIANLRTMGYDPEAPTEIAIGVGQYKSETGLALGVFHYPNQDFMLSASISTSGDEVMGGIGATWKLGRKSAAEKAKDEEARRLEKAEEMKKLAQDAKVKAQAERHAKLLAEREAQKTA